SSTRAFATSAAATSRTPCASCTLPRAKRGYQYQVGGAGSHPVCGVPNEGPRPGQGGAPMQPYSAPLEPVDVEVHVDQRQLRVAWSDGHAAVYDFEFLRWQCP